MDVLKARKKALGEGEKKAETSLPMEEKPSPEKKRAKKKKVASSRKKSGAKTSKKTKKVIPEKPEMELAPEQENFSSEPELPAKMPAEALPPEEMELSEEDIRGLYKTDEMPELPDLPTEEDMPKGAEAPEEMELTEEDLGGLYKTQEMPELPEMDFEPGDEADLLIMGSKPEEEKEISAPSKEDQIKESAPDVEPDETSDTVNKGNSVLIEEARDGDDEIAKETEEQPLEFLSFMLGREEYALPLARISEIIKPRDVTGVPRCPEFVLGIISLRGVVIPVFDLAKRLNLGNVDWSRRSRIMVVRREDTEMVGLAVDSVKDVVRVLPSDIEPPPPAMGGLEVQFLEGVGRAEEGRGVRIENAGGIKDVEAKVKESSTKRKLVILLNLDRVAVL